MSSETSTTTSATEPQPTDSVADAEEVTKLNAHVADGDDGIVATGESEGEAAEESEDSLTFSNGVVEKIVAITMQDVPGVVGMRGSWFNRVQGAFGVDDTTKGVTVEVTPDSAVRVNIAVEIEFGVYAPKVFEDTKAAVVQAIHAMTGLEVRGVNLRIEDVLTREEVERRQARARREAAAAEAEDAPE